MTAVRGDITQQQTDAIVNAANTALMGGSGVDAAIHRAAGSELLKECALLGGCPTGQARLTAGYKLPARFVIHTVGPVWRGGGQGEAELLAACYQNSLNLAREYNIKTIAFPAISTGAYGYPIREASFIAVRATSAFLRNNLSLEKVIFVLFSQQAYQEYRDRIKEISI